MLLNIYTGDKIKAIYTSEKQIQDFLIENLRKVLNLNFLVSEYIVNITPTSIGRIDILAKNDLGDLFVIEIKAKKCSSMLLQGLEYVSALKKTLPDFPGLSGEIKLLCIAPEYSDRMISSLSHINTEVLLYSVTTYDNEIIDIKPAIPGLYFKIEEEHSRIQNDTILDKNIWIHSFKHVIDSNNLSDYVLPDTLLDLLHEYVKESGIKLEGTENTMRMGQVISANKEQLKEIGLVMINKKKSIKGEKRRVWYINPEQEKSV